MNLTLSEFKKLKGSYLVDTRYNSLCVVESATTKYIKIKEFGGGLSTIMTDIFLKKRQEFYEPAPEQRVAKFMKEKIRTWFQQYGSLIKGFYLSHEGHKEGGWNGTMTAMNEVEKIHPLNVDYDFIPDGFLEKMVDEYV